MSLAQQTKKYFKNNKFPLRKRGQNFLINKNAIQKIINASNLYSSDQVVEIGAGTGNLTKFLLKAKKIIAIEIDGFLINILKKRFENNSKVVIKNKDIREFSLTSLNLKDYKVISNIPFNITGLLIKKLLTENNKPKNIIIVLQKQVGKRIVANPPNMSLLSVSVKFFGKPEIIGNISKNSFWPRPKVDSVILKIKPNKKYSITKDKFFKVVKAGFRHPRKYLLNNLFLSGIINKEKAREFFKELNLNLKIRAEKLNVKDWVDLANLIFKK